MLPGSEDWLQVVIRPGEHPMRELRAVSVDLDARHRMVLVVDQFEEAFTVCSDDEERAAYIAELLRIAERRRGRGSVVVAIRAD